MLSKIKNYLARQAQNPFGWFGRIMAPLVFNHENKQMEDFGLQRMAPLKDDDILEIGFGHGRLLSKLVPQITDGKVSGINISKQMIKVTAKQNLKEVKRVLKPNGQFFCAFRDKDLMESKGSAVTDNREIFQNLYQPIEVKQLFREASFTEVQLHQKTTNSETIFLAVGAF